MPSLAISSAELERNRERYGVVQAGRWRSSKICAWCRRATASSIRSISNISPRWSPAPCAMAARIAFPDSLVGMDSHTPMVNALGVFGWGVGGIEAATAMFGQPVGLPTPRVVGCRLTGAPRAGVMCTDIVLALTRFLRGADVLAAVVEFCGPALDASVAARSRHHRQHGGRIWRHHGFLPHRCGDAALSAADRPSGRTDRPGRALCQGAGTVARGRTCVPDLAGIRHRQRRAIAGGSVAAGRVWWRLPTRRSVSAAPMPARGAGEADAPPVTALSRPLQHGDIAIASIASCTNTANPYQVIAAGLAGPQRRRQGLARQALGKNLFLARLARGSGDAGQGRPHRRRWMRWASSWSASAA